MTTPDSPVPSFPDNGNPYGAPPPRKSRKKLLFIVGGVIAVLLIAIVVVAVVVSKGTIASIDDAKAGDCITVTGSNTDATAKTAKCDAETFSFIVAEQLSGSDAKCASEDYSELSQKDKGKLCLVPNLRVDKCYQVPAASGGSLTDFKEVDCAATPDGSKPVGKVIKREDSATPDCAEGNGTVAFDKPSPLGYCIEPLTQ